MIQVTTISREIGPLMGARVVLVIDHPGIHHATVVSSFRLVHYSPSIVRRRRVAWTSMVTTGCHAANQIEPKYYE